MVVLETTAIISIVGWAASPVINRLIGKVQSYTAKKYKWHKDLEEKLESVAHFLVEMRSTVRLVEEAARRRTDDPSMECWMSQLKDAVDDMDDFFDILDYEIIHKSNKLSADDPPPPPPPPPPPSIGSDESSDMLKTLLKKLDDIRQSSRGLVQASMLAATVAGCSDSRSSSSSTSSSRRPVTGPLLPQEEEPLGYGEQYEKLIQWLLPDLDQKLTEDDGSCNSDRGVVGIIGHGGMGKTTLAQKACNDPAVTKRFDLIIWACVYNKFGEADLLGEIWRSAPAEAVPAARLIGDMSFSSMQLALGKLVAASERYLLVLDDVCNDETATDLQRRQTWRNVLAPFQRGDRGSSRVLLTTRAIISAQTVGADRSRRIVLDGIDRDSFVCLLKRSASIGIGGAHAPLPLPLPLLEEVLTSSALFSSNSSSSSEWKRSPLSAREMGLKLRSTSIKKRWEDILRTDCHENVIASHVSSYQQLPPHLQYCFAFVSLFPNGFKFHAEMLVKMWVAHGFIIGEGDEDGNTMEDTASGYLNDLVSRSFFQEMKQDKRVTHYLIHEQIHSMIRFVSANYFLMVHGNNTNTTFAAAARSIPHTVRHLSVTEDGCLGCLLVHLKKHTSVLKRLRTILVLRGDDSSGPAKPPCVACAWRSSKREKASSAASSLTAIGKDVLRELSGLRILDLTGIDIAELPPEIGKLIHLRYLVLPDTLRELPEQVNKLLHLQVLVRRSDAPTQTAALLHDDGNKFNQPFTFCANKAGLSQLAGMNSLRGALRITGLDAVSNKKDASKAKLRKKKSVKDLNLEWDKNDSETSSQHHQDVLEALQPHFGIRALQIRRYRGISSPSWLRNNCLEQLTHLQLINCREWVTLPALGHLPRLNHLHIHEMDSVIQIDGSGPFKSLETLELSAMKSLVQWTAGATDSAFTLLKNVKIRDCPELQILPPILQKTMDRRVVI